MDMKTENGLRRDFRRLTASGYRVADTSNDMKKTHKKGGSMMTIKIRHRFTGRIMLSGEFDSVKECVEKNKNLSGANLSGAILSRTDLTKTDLSEANLTGANLTGANLSGADLSWANLSGADLSRTDLSEADLMKADLSWADLSEADLSGADLLGADLMKADLSWANLSGAILSWADLSEADLMKADLSWANLSGADLSRTDLMRADLSGADLRNIINYQTNHDIFIQLIKNNLNKFTKHQRAVAYCIFNWKLCWDTIRKEYKKEAEEIFNLLAKLGWSEYKETWEKL